MNVNNDTSAATHVTSHHMIDPIVLTASLAVFAVLSYFLCIALALLFPAMAASMQVLYPAIFPGFVWLTAGSIAWGAAFLAIASLYVGCGFAFVYNIICRIAHPKRRMGA